jgi:hypothetical protein
VQVAQPECQGLPASLALRDCVVTLDSKDQQASQEAPVFPARLETREQAVCKIISEKYRGSS